MNEQEQQIVQLVQAAMQGNQQAQQQIQQIQQAAQQGNQQAVQLMQMIQQIAQQLQQQQAQVARLGAKLQYINQLRGKCPEGYEMQYFKNGGTCGKCVAKQAMQQGGDMDPVSAFKCGRKMKPKSACGSKMKAACGSKVQSNKCGKPLLEKRGGKKKKCELGALLEKCGGKAKKKKCEEGAMLKCGGSTPKKKKMSCGNKLKNC